MEFLIGSPFSSPVGQRIERATSAALHAEDWALNMEICDIINETDEGPKDAVKAVKKRIVGNKSFMEIMLALTVLEACVKNCGHRFHVLVASQDFVEGVLVRAILPKNNPPTTLHDRVLSLIQAWADAFRSSPSLGGVVCVYEDLRRRGLEFPMTDLDALSPIHTPLRSIPENDSSVTVPAPPPQSQTPRGPAASSPTQAALTAVPPQLSDGPISISPEQAQKLRVDLALVRGNLTVMTEMLNQLTPGQSPQEDSELLQQLYQVCREMQSRVVELIPRLLDEGLIEELLVVNDDLNNAFIRYDRFDRLNKAQRTATEQHHQEHDPMYPLPYSRLLPGPTSLTSALCPSPSANQQPPLRPPANPHSALPPIRGRQPTTVHQRRMSLTCLPRPGAALWPIRGRVCGTRTQEQWKDWLEPWTPGYRSLERFLRLSLALRTPPWETLTDGCLRTQKRNQRLGTGKG
ncbi:target of Myb1 membrane trafficking protein-like isoform X3 [Oncorhynchus nerka]|uniref:target of Myb1 membrane trafficking protein-like isoform X3 n=1 Tax=Oncorhynchus nerka TaxID=8023 RepID=UPI00113102D3|nr:target of Myb protein 1-like isoform X3 [Oncorhynchus nerka]